MPSLRELQARFSAALTPGRSGAADPALLGLIDGGGALDAAARLAIYADMYRARLEDVLRDDFARVLALVGDDTFTALATRYIARHPSTHPSVRWLGARFADFLAADADVPPFLADLARLEWARGGAFDAPDAEPLRLDDLRSMAPEDWPGLRFRPIPACRVIACGWPVHQLWAAAGSDAPAAWPAIPAPTVIRVWREGWSVSHAAMPEREQTAFRLLQRGEPFAALCAALGDTLDPETAAREVGGLLLRWIEDGLLARLNDPPVPG
jgi:hypothetical protein